MFFRVYERLAKNVDNGATRSVYAAFDLGIRDPDALDAAPEIGFLADSIVASLNAALDNTPFAFDQLLA